MPGPAAIGNKRKQAIKSKVAKLYPKKNWPLHLGTKKRIK